MTTTAPIPAAEATPPMAQSSDTEAQAPSEQAQARTSAGRPRLREQIAENPLLTLFGTIMVLFGTVVVALLIFSFGTINARIDDTNNSINARIDDTNNSINARIDRLEDRFASLEQRVIEIDRKLNALIAALNATETVYAVLEGRGLLGQTAAAGAGSTGSMPSSS